MARATKICTVCGKEKSLREFAYRSKKCHDCNPSSEKIKMHNARRQQIYKTMQEFHNDTCNNDCDNCGFHKYCQRVLDIFNDTNWSEGEE